MKSMSIIQSTHTEVKTSKDQKTVTYRITTVDDVFVATVKFKNLPTGKYADQRGRVIKAEAASLARIIKNLCY